MAYKHGTYGASMPSSESISSSKSIPVYIGTAPIFRVENRNNELRPVLINNLSQAMTKLGYKQSDDFEEFTLSQCVYAHFQNSIEPIGPIICINVLDTSKHSSISNESVTLINEVGIIEKHVDISSVTIENKVEGTDYKLSYTDEGYLKLTNLTDLSSPVEVKFKVIDTGEVTKSDIIGISNETESTGIQAIHDVYESLNKIPVMISAPKFNFDPEVRQALLSFKSGISDKWESTIFTDIDSDTADSIESAIEWKDTKGYSSSAEKICWPKAIMGGRELYMSVIAIVRKMQTDYENGDIPFETPSNKQIDISGIVANGKKIRLTQTKANELNEKGITTAIFNCGKYVLWGPHMSSYCYGTTESPDEMFDVNVFMHKYLINDFNLRNGSVIDQSMSRNDIDSLINQEESILAAHVSAGRLLFGKVEFTKDLNTTSDIVAGDFAFKSLVTEVPLAKSITNHVQYTSEGIKKLYADENEEEEGNS